MTNVTHKFPSIYLFITLYMFRAHSAHHQERQIVSIQPQVTIILCWWPSCVQVGTLLPTCTQLLIKSLSLKLPNTFCWYYITKSTRYKNFRCCHQSFHNTGIQNVATRSKRRWCGYRRNILATCSYRIFIGNCTAEPTITDQSWGSVRTLDRRRSSRRRHQKHFITTWQSGSANTPVQFSVGRPTSDSDTVLSLRGCQATERSAASCFDRLCGVQCRGREMGVNVCGKWLK